MVDLLTIQPPESPFLKCFLLFSERRGELEFANNGVGNQNKSFDRDSFTCNYIKHLIPFKYNDVLTLWRSYAYISIKVYFNPTLSKKNNNMIIIHWTHKCPKYMHIQCILNFTTQITIIYMKSIEGKNIKKTKKNTKLDTYFRSIRRLQSMISPSIIYQEYNSTSNKRNPQTQFHNGVFWNLSDLH